MTDLGFIAGAFIIGAAMLGTLYLHTRMLTAVLDRFLSRHFDEYNMGQILRKTAEVEQEEEQSDQQQIVSDWYNEQESELRKMEAMRRGGTS